MNMDLSVAVVTYICLVFKRFTKNKVLKGRTDSQRDLFFCVHHPGTDKFINIIKCITWPKAAYSFKRKQSSEDVLAFNGTAFYS